MNDDGSALRERLGLLSERAPAIFGADGHRFELNAPLSEPEARSFEACHGIKLPEDYRWFVTTIGNGGVGPHYGVFPLGKTDDGHGLADWTEGDGFIGTLSLAFPHTDSWNDLGGEPTEELMEADPARYESELEKFEARYFDAALMNGAVPPCHMGCAQRIWLVVSGPERGHVWFDKRTDHEGLSPIMTASGNRAHFLDWYEDWLKTSLSEPTSGNAKSPRHGPKSVFKILRTWWNGA